MIPWNENHTNVPVLKTTRERLKEQKRRGESYDDVINRLIDEKEHRLDDKIRELKKLMK